MQIPFYRKSPRQGTAEVHDKEDSEEEDSEVTVAQTETPAMMELLLNAVEKMNQALTRLEGRWGRDTGPQHPNTAKHAPHIC